jgi:ABC-type multidrug transport system fused ATPase/permease subunit
LAITNPQIQQAFSLLSKKTRWQLFAASVIRIVLNVLDLAALAIVGAVGYLVANPTRHIDLQSMPLSLNLQLGIVEVPLLAVVATFLFLLKSTASSLFTFAFAARVSHLETSLSKQWLLFYFGKVSDAEDVPDGPSVQATLLRSVNALVTGILTSFVTLISEGTLLLSLVVGFVLLNPFGATLVVVYLGLVVIALSRFILPRIQKASAEDYASSRQIMTLTRDYMSNRKSIVIHGVNRQWIDALANAKGKQIRSANRGVSLSTLPRNLIEAALILGVFGFLGMAMLFSDIPSQAVTIGVFLVGGLRMVSAVLPLQAAAGVLKQSLSAVDDALSGLMAGSASKESSLPIGLSAPDEPTIQVRDLTFSRPGSEFKLQSMTFDVPFGSKIAIVGPSGAGKSTLGELLLGLRLPTTGAVLVNGVASSDLIKHGRTPFAYVPQSSQIIDGTFAENVTLSRNPDALDRTRALHALRACGLLDLVNRQPLGLDTELSVGEGSLSGGEIQRLGLARALFTNPKILVLDEATSALDASTEHHISQTLKTFRGNCTLIVIAHRLSTIVDADKILYLDQGAVVASGTYDHLIANVPDFKDAVRILSTNAPETNARD